MDLTSPYNELELKIALMSASSKLEEASLQESLFAKICEIAGQPGSEDSVDLNKKTAEFHGISVVDLINSPNYITLKSEYSKKLLYKILNVYKEFNFTDKEAWALICASLEYLSE